MDISNLGTQENASNGKWFQAVLYGKKQPFAIKILGSDSDEVRIFKREQMKQFQSGKIGNNEYSDEYIDSLFETSNESALVRIVGLSSIKQGKFKSDFELIDEPLTLGDEPLTNEKKSYKRLLEAIPEVKDFVLKKSNERANFLD